MKYAVLGHPIAHSLSPRMQNAAMKKMGLDAVYLAFDVPPERLMKALEFMAEIGFSGVNLTVPLKEVAFRGLSAIDSHAQSLGSVNTVKFVAGKMKGYSTDGPGFLAALKKVFNRSPKGLSVFLLGCGGAGRAVGLTCASAGASRILLADSEPGRAKKLLADIKALKPSPDVEIVSANQAERNLAARSAQLIVQASPVGMHATDRPLLDAEAFSEKQMLYDLIYMFPETGLMKIARKQGANVANGIDMLAFQGALALEIWTGQKAPADVMRKALEKAVYGY
jgi:shikimate dehydrogenase